MGDNDVLWELWMPNERKRGRKIMATYRVHKTRDYTVMSNAHLRDRDLSLKAKGLLSVMLSLPEDWDYSINGLIAICKENETAVKSTLHELKKCGYLIVTKLNPSETTSGRFEYQYDIYEQPYDNQCEEKQAVEKQGVENLPVENQGQYNTNKSNTNKSNIKDKKKERKNGSFDAIISEYTTDEKTVDLLKEWLKARKAKRAAMTDRAIQLNINKLDDIAKQSNMTVNEYLESVIMKGWAAFYPITTYSGASAKAGNKPKGYEEPTYTSTDEDWLSWATES